MKTDFRVHIVIHRNASTEHCAVGNGQCALCILAVVDFNRI